MVMVVVVLVLMVMVVDCRHCGCGRGSCTCCGGGHCSDGHHRTGRCDYHRRGLAANRRDWIDHGHGGDHSDHHHHIDGRRLNCRVVMVVIVEVVVTWLVFMVIL